MIDAPRSFIFSSCGEHLRLHGDIERRGRLVGDHDVGVERDRRRDERALPQAAGELVGTLPGAHCGGRHADPGEQLEHAVAHARGAVAPAVQAQRLGDLRADRAQRIEGDERVLQDESDIPAAHPPPLRAR